MTYIIRESDAPIRSGMYLESNTEAIDSKCHNKDGEGGCG